MEFNIENLKESKDFLNSVLNSITTGVLLIDKEMLIYSFNESGRAIFSDTKGNIKDNLFGDALKCKSSLTEDVQCGKGKICYDCVFRNSILKTFTQQAIINKKKFEVEIFVNVAYVKKIFEFSTKNIVYNGEPLILVIIDDITESESQKLQLIKVNEEKNKYLGIVSHDLRSPLSTVQMYCDFILDTMGQNLNTTFLEYIESIRNISSNSLALVEDILDVAKIESGTLTLQRKHLNYYNFIECIIRLNKPIAERKNIQVVFESAFKDLYISIDGKKMEQVINNLISNAVKYSLPDTTIFVKLSKQDKAVLTEVIDEGLGIPDDEMNKLFKPFQTTSVKTTGGEKSTGLGLAIVRRIVEAHNGTIDVKSEVGKGSDFYFTLPL